MKYRLAIGTKDKKNITEHFGQCERFYILDIEQENDEIIYVEDRSVNVKSHSHPLIDTSTLAGSRDQDTNSSEPCGNHSDEKIRAKIEALKDCQIVLVNQIGGQSEKLLIHNGIVPLKFQGSIEDALAKIVKYYKRQIFLRKE